ncbi:hypothetical protein EYC84_007239 [Monilinia fructicola]|uniref:Uncharacterized protein n=1 Tax=Monilinia fructicola TaxID=38448 RepID=A0A5M9K9S0_MONFR|nr:hypothetical protein EYC84_007239 [Monilinia fructicola]
MHKSEDWSILICSISRHFKWTASCWFNFLVMKYHMYKREVDDKASSTFSAKVPQLIMEPNQPSNLLGKYRPHIRVSRRWSGIKKCRYAERSKKKKF